MHAGEQGIYARWKKIVNKRNKCTLLRKKSFQVFQLSSTCTHTHTHTNCIRLVLKGKSGPSRCPEVDNYELCLPTERGSKGERGETTNISHKKFQIGLQYVHDLPCLLMRFLQFCEELWNRDGQSFMKIVAGNNCNVTISMVFNWKSPIIVNIAWDEKSTNI